MEYLINSVEIGVWKTEVGLIEQYPQNGNLMVADIKN